MTRLPAACLMPTPQDRCAAAPKGRRGRSGVTAGLAAVVLAMGLALGAGCEEPAECRAACEHTCDICGSDCSDEAIDTCTQSCEDGQTSRERAACVLDTEVCDDLWKC